MPENDSQRSFAAPTDPADTDRSTTGNPTNAGEPPAPDAGADRHADGADRADSSYSPPATQEELERIINARLGRERAKYDHLKAAAEELATIKDSQKTDQERQSEALRSAEERAAKAEAGLLRFEVAREKDVAEWADLLSGDREDMEAQADRILKRLEKAKAPRSPRPDPNQGRPSSGPKSTADAFAAALEGRF